MVYHGGEGSNRISEVDKLIAALAKRNGAVAGAEASPWGVREFAFGQNVPPTAIGLHDLLESRLARV